MKKTLLSILALTSSTAFLAQCNEVFISEFLDGWSNNRALEIYNPTDNPIDLLKDILMVVLLHPQIIH